MRCLAEEEMAMRGVRMLGLAAALALLAATGCGDDNGDAEENGAVESTATTRDEVVVELTSDGECTLPASTVATGIIDVSVTNDSDEPLVVGVRLIEEGRTLDEVQAALDAEPALELEVVGGGNREAAHETPPDGETTEILALTEAGEYAVACVTEAEPGVLASEALVVEG
jgi:hypothetical protein